MIATIADYEYIAIGHVVVDLIEDESLEQAGGGALYSALQAARLGLRALIITAGNPAELADLISPFAHELDIVVQPTLYTTRFATTGRGAARVQRLLSWAGEMRSLPILAAPIVHFAPVARETPTRALARADLVCWTPQGVVRCWDRDGEISLRPLSADDVPLRCDAMVLSTSELTSMTRAVDLTIASGGVVAVTDGEDDVAVRTSDSRMTFPVPRSNMPGDDLGAGDVFAAAFFVALHKGCDIFAAVSFAQAAASVRLRGQGPAAIGDYGAISQIQDEVTGARGHRVD